MRLGSITTGSARIAEAARDAVLSSGKVAVLVSHATGEAVAIPYTDIEYDWLVRRHAEHLVGVYTDDVDDRHTVDVARQADLLREITDDLCEHVKQSRWWLIAKSAKQMRAA